jgi:hypothetical protein
MKNLQEKEEITKIIMHIKEISKDDLYEANKEYNPSEWKNNLDSYDKYKNVKFYIATRNESATYDSYYAEYTIPEGITLFASVSYSHSMTNNGFVRIGITTGGTVRRFLLNGQNGEYGRLRNDKHNRKIMAKQSKEHGFIWSNKF